MIDTFLKVNRIDDALKVLNTVVDASLRVVASFGNRVFDELIKNGKASDCAPRFCPDPSKYHQGPRKWVGNRTHHLDPPKCLLSRPHYPSSGSPQMSWQQHTPSGPSHSLFPPLSFFLPQSVPQPLKFFSHKLAMLGYQWG